PRGRVARRGGLETADASPRRELGEDRQRPWPRRLVLDVGLRRHRPRGRTQGGEGLRRPRRLPLGPGPGPRRAGEAPGRPRDTAALGPGIAHRPWRVASRAVGRGGPARGAGTPLLRGQPPAMGPPPRPLLSRPPDRGRPPRR